MESKFNPEPRPNFMAFQNDEDILKNWMMRSAAALPEAMASTTGPAPVVILPAANIFSILVWPVAGSTHRVPSVLLFN